MFLCANQKTLELVRKHQQSFLLKCAKLRRILEGKDDGKDNGLRGRPAANL